MTKALQKLETVTQISPSVIRILAGNPGKFTLQGTNTYLVSPALLSSGENSSAVPAQLGSILIDTGEGKESFISTLRSILRGQDSIVGERQFTITDIVLTHWHHDHIGGLPSVLHLLQSLNRPPPRLHKLLDGENDEKVHEILRDVSPDLVVRPPASDKDGQRTGEGMLHALKDDDRINVVDGQQGKDSLRVIHSPGHTSDHVCLLHEGQGLLFTGDHVLGEGTSVFEDLGAYMRSLRRCKEVLEVEVEFEHNSLARHLCPAHGPLIEDGIGALEQYVHHRLEREEQILGLLASESEGQKFAQWTIPVMVSKIYAGYPENLYPAAARGIFLHLRKLALPDGETPRPDSLPLQASHGHQFDGRRVECTGNGAGDNGLAPPLPKDDSDWLKAMDLRWSLINKDIVSENREAL